MYRVLIAEDEIIVRKWLAGRINWQACGLVLCGEAANGQEGLEIYGREKPDIILTDLRMPVMDGLAFLEAVREQDKRVRFLVLTCLDEFALAKKAIDLDVTSYILKLTSEPDEVVREFLKARDFLLRFDGTTEKEKETKEQTAHNPRLAAALQYMGEHFAENISQLEIAEYAGVSAGYLGKLFLKYFNSTFTDELNRLRVEKAKELLNIPSCRIYEIAEKVGFMNTTYFFRVFKKYENCTPTEYRLNLAEGGVKRK